MPNFTIDLSQWTPAADGRLRGNDKDGAFSAATIPVWGTIPDLNLTVGQAVAFSLGTYITNDGGDANISFAIASGALPAGITLNSDGTFSGTATTEAAGVNIVYTATSSAGVAVPNAGHTVTINPFVQNYLPTATGYRFFDEFDYDVDTNAAPATYSETNNPFVTQGGWDWVKATNISGDGTPDSGGRGSLSTVTSVPGYIGDIPTLSPSGRALRIEQRSGTLQDQTDFYLQLGNGINTPVVPADVWFQFWIYAQNFDTESGNLGSGQSGEAKFIYGASNGWPSNDGNWLLSISKNILYPYNRAANDLEHNIYFRSDGYTHPTSPSGYMQSWQHPDVMNNFAPLQAKLGHTVDPDFKVTQNQWFLVKLHMNNEPTSNRRCFEMWIRPKDSQTWTKTAEWIDGETVNGTVVNINSNENPNIPGFYGMSGFRFPTTMGRAVDANPEGNSDSWMYITDFTVVAGVDSDGGGEDDLPIYNEF